MAQGEVAFSQLDKRFVSVDCRQLLKLRYTFAARNFLHCFLSLLICDPNLLSFRNVKAIFLAKLFVECNQILSGDQRISEIPYPAGFIFWVKARFFAFLSVFPVFGSLPTPA